MRKKGRVGVFGGARKRTFRFAEKNASFQKGRTFRFADYIFMMECNYLINIKDTAKYFEKVNFALNSFKDRFVPQH